MKLIETKKFADIKLTLEKVDLVKTGKVAIGATTLGLALLALPNKGEVNDISEKEYISGACSPYIGGSINIQDLLIDECSDVLCEFDSSDRSYVKNSVILDTVRNNIKDNAKAAHDKNILNEDTDLELSDQLIVLAEDISKNPSDYNLDNSIYTDGVTGYLGEFLITGYCGCSQCCGKSNGITASGARAVANHTLAADSRFAFGTELCIDGVNYEVEDRGGAIHGNRIDRFFSSHSEALAFGKRSASVYSVEKTKTLALRYSK